MSPAIVFDSVTKTFTDKGSSFDALKDVSLTVEEGDIYALVGFSGAGKSTLLRTINGLESPTSGTVTVGGEQISALTAGELRRARRGIGMIFQQFNLLRSRTVYRNIAYPLKLAGYTKAQILDRAVELLEFVGLEDRALHYPSQLSGGQKQRVGIARALATSPSILIADEATSALDPQTTDEVLDLLRKVNREFGVTVVLVTHEMDVVRKIANRVAVLQNGSVVESGSVYDVFSHPQAETSRRFVSSVFHHEPSPETLERLRKTHPGRLIRVQVENEGSAGPVLSRLAKEHDVEFSVVFGGVSEIQGRSFGSLTVELTGEPERVDRALEALAAVTLVTDVGGQDG